MPRYQKLLLEHCLYFKLSGDDYLMIWNFKTGNTLHRLSIQKAKYIRALALAPGGEFFLSASKIWFKHKTLRLWNLQKGECVEEFHFDQGVQAIACDSNGMVCVGLEGGRVCFLRFNNLSNRSGQLRQEVQK